MSKLRIKKIDILSAAKMYAIFGFISGLIGALLYNIFAKMVGGIEIEVESI